jgi:hypothetical protein
MTTGCNTRSVSERAPSPIGRITLGTKPAGERRTGNLYAPFERAGAGDGRFAYRASPRPYMGTLRSRSHARAEDLVERAHLEGEVVRAGALALRGAPDEGDAVVVRIDPEEDHPARDHGVGIALAHRDIPLVARPRDTAPSLRPAADGGKGRSA